MEPMGKGWDLEIYGFMFRVARSELPSLVRRNWRNI